MDRTAFEKLKAQVLAKVNDSAHLETLFKAAEIVKASLDGEKVADELEAGQRSRRHEAWKFWGTTLGPLLTVLSAFGALLFSIVQTRSSIQSQQMINEDSQWHEAMRQVSFKDSSAALVGALNMESFFGSPRYKEQARTCAVSLLPEVQNVSGFDSVCIALGAHTTKKNQGDLMDLSQKIADKQWAMCDPKCLDEKSPFVPAFIKWEVLRTDNPVDVGAWELDTVSKQLEQFWKSERALPKGQNLTRAVLENGNFSDLDFRGVVLRHAILSNSNFMHADFFGSDFTGTLLDCVNLQGANLAEIKEFENSKWNRANWWDAHNLPEELKIFLMNSFPRSEDQTGACPWRKSEARK